MPGRAEGSAGGLLERPTHPFDAGSTFVLAAGALRRLRGDGETFLGYAGEELFWRDVLQLVHEEDLVLADKLVSGAIGRPHAVRNAALRLRDASGEWRLVKATVRNVVEAPGDMGLVLADLHEVSANGRGRP